MAVGCYKYDAGTQPRPSTVQRYKQGPGPKQLLFIRPCELAAARLDDAFL